MFNSGKSEKIFRFEMSARFISFNIIVSIIVNLVFNLCSYLVS